MASFRVTTADIQNEELAIDEKKKQLVIMKLRKNIQEMEENTLPGLKAQLKELEAGSSSSSPSPGESKTEASASTKEVSFVN